MINLSEMPLGNFRSLAGYASESLVVGRAMLCGYNVFVKSWRDSKYDAVLDADGSLFRIEIKGTINSVSITTSSGGRSGEQISREVESREHSLSKKDCDWLIAITSTNNQCWVIPVEFIEILGVHSITLNHLDMFKEKWSIFVNKDPNIKPYLKSGYRDLDESHIKQIAESLDIDISIATEEFSFDMNNNRVRKHQLSTKDRLVIAIWEKIFTGKIKDMKNNTLEYFYTECNNVS